MRKMRKSWTFEKFFDEAGHAIQHMRESPADQIARDRVLNLLHVLEKFDPPLAFLPAVEILKNKLRLYANSDRRR